ncbi:hypothetical protein ADIS_4669 [Lunatimonas lonarensis]|uniref:NB-ARC domain-containing protein n=1 Tax=Lunatimonas lonarensis TaxID=1232681 RepID=R7ZLG0_9BACT|nr:tetratricopeptide repeat protein [Lunatimonas lonarensis]EON74874.1 hypothetical protein ADIS_4669 [Lunatimonas lonarensis]
MSIKQYPIFLASSYELQPEREKFEIFIGRQNKRLVKKNVQFHLEIWEDMGAELNNGRKQDDYNKILNDAEIVVVLFWTKMGKYTQEEFELAYGRFKETGRPIIYVYEKTQEENSTPKEWEIKSKMEFLDRLLTLGKEQFHSTFQHKSDLLYHFQQTLFDLFDKGTLQVGEPIKTLSRNAPHSPSFVIGREEMLAEISNKLSGKGKVVLISAEGGMGKTTLAAKYWHENKYTYGHGVYLFCERGILNSMMDDRLGLELQGMDEDQKIRQIQRKLNSLGDEVLLFLDNANDAEDIRKFLREFSGFNGNILITSRCREVLVDLENEILIKHLHPTDAKELFTKNYREEGPEFETLLEKFLNAIDFHTLLIEVFSKNLKKASARGIDLKGFLERFEEKGIHLERIANTRVKTDYAFFVNSEAASPNAILEVLYDFSNLSEADRYCLVNLALLPVNGYSQQFLLDIFEPEDNTGFYETLDNLYQKGWIGGDYDALRLSPVVQKLVLHRNQETLWEDGKIWVKKLTGLIQYEENKDNYHTKFQWIPFGRQLVKAFSETDSNDLSLLWNNLGILFREIGDRKNLEEAKQNLEKALDSDIRNFGEESPSVATSRSNLAMVYKDLGGEANLLDAKAYLEKALASLVRNFGEDYPLVARCCSNLAMVYQDLGGDANLMEAREHLEKALASDIRNFGEDSPSAAIRRSNLAAVLRDLGGDANLLEAGAHLEKALSSFVRNAGEDSPSVATSRSNLAMIYKDLGGEPNLLEAKEHLEKALSSLIRNFGEDFRSAARCHSNLALVLRDLGGEANLLEAREHLEKALASDIRNFGEDSPSVATRRSNLALVYQALGGEANLLVAKPHLEKALSSDIRNFGEENPITLTGKFNLGGLMVYLGKKDDLEEAIKLLEQALKGYINNFGEEYYLVPITIEWKKYAEKRIKEIEGK